MGRVQAYTGSRSALVKIRMRQSASSDPICILLEILLYALCNILLRARVQQKGDNETVQA